MSAGAFINEVSLDCSWRPGILYIRGVEGARWTA
jgi:hypothetical protein